MSLSRSRLHVDLTRHVWRLGWSPWRSPPRRWCCAARPPRRRRRCSRRPRCARAPGQFIVVAVANPVTGRPGAVGGTAHGYGTSTNYRVSASATALIREIARQYSLTPVSEWPIEQLQMHCVLFRIPPGTTREAVIEKLQGRQARAHRAAAQRIRVGGSRTRQRPVPGASVRRSLRAAAVERQRARRRRSAQLQPRRRHSRGHHRHRRRHPPSRSRGPHAAHPQLHRQRRRRVPRRSARHAGGGPDRRRRQQRHRHRRRGAGRQAAGLQGLLAGLREHRRPLQFLHHRAGAGRCAGRQGAGHQPESRRPERSLARSADRARPSKLGVIVVGAVSDDPRFGFPAKLPRRAAGRPKRKRRSVPAKARRHPARARRATSSRWCPMATTISRPAVRSRPRRSPAWSRCCWPATRSSASMRLRDMLAAVHRKT